MMKIRKETLHIKQGLTEIGEFAWSGAGGRFVEWEIFVPEGVRLIRKYAFSGMNILSIHLPSTIEMVDTNAFAHACVGEIKVPKGCRESCKSVHGLRRYHNRISEEE